MYWCLTRILPGGVNNFPHRSPHRAEATPGSMHSRSLGRNSAVTSTSSDQAPGDRCLSRIRRRLALKGRKSPRRLFRPFRGWVRHRHEPRAHARGYVLTPLRGKKKQTHVSMRTNPSQRNVCFCDGRRSTRANHGVKCPNSRAGERQRPPYIPNTE